MGNATVKYFRGIPFRVIANHLRPNTIWNRRDVHLFSFEWECSYCGEKEAHSLEGASDELASVMAAGNDAMQTHVKVAHDDVPLTPTRFADWLYHMQYRPPAWVCTYDPDWHHEPPNTAKQQLGEELHKQIDVRRHTIVADVAKRRWPAPKNLNQSL